MADFCGGRYRTRTCDFLGVNASAPRKYKGFFDNLERDFDNLSICGKRFWFSLNHPTLSDTP